MQIVNLENFICDYCSIDYKCLKGLNMHLRLTHSLTFFDYLTKLNLIPKCKTCGKDVQWVQSNKFLNCCSKQCYKIHFYSDKIAGERKLKQSIKRKEFIKKNRNKHNWSLYHHQQSKPEELFSSVLKKCIIDDIIIQWYIPEESERNYEIDFVLLNKKIGFEINGNQHYNKNGELTDHCQFRHDYLESLGWKIVEIHYLKCFDDNELKKIIQKSINNEIIFLDQETQQIFEYKKLKQIKLNEKNRQHKERIENKKTDFLKKQNEKILKVLNSNIDFSKFGWVNKISEILYMKSGKINQWMKRYMLDFYEKKCFKKQKYV